LVRDDFAEEMQRERFSMKRRLVEFRYDRALAG
jgi:hypothetical protein